MSDAKPMRIPLLTPLESRDATTLYDSKAVNCVTELTPLGKKPMPRKRPGLAFAAQGAAGVGQGITNYQNNLYGISGDVFNAFTSASTFTAIKATATASFSQRVGPMVAGFNGFLYVMGGMNSSGTALNDVWRSADGVNWVQITAAAPWAARSKGQAIVFNNALYIMGGAVSATGTHFSDVWSTTDGITWTQQNASAWPARRRFGVCTTATAMYIAGGAGPNATSNLVYPNTKYSDVWYTTDGVHWTQAVAQAPWVARSDLAFYSIGTNLYVCGGLLIDAFANATSDLWQSTNGGVTWTMASANPFGVAASPVWPIAALNSSGMDFPTPSPITISGGSGGSSAAAWAFTDFDDDWDDDDLSPGPYVEVTFSNVGSGYTAPPTVAFSTNIGFNAGAYALLDGTSNGGSKACRSVQVGSTVYILELQATGTYDHVLWSTANGTTLTNTSCNFSAGWVPRDGEFFYYGNLWFTSGFNGVSTYYNDVWFISAGGLTFALNPNVPLGFYHFNQTSATIASPLLVFKSTGDLYTFNSALNVLAKYSSAANYPATTVPGLAVLDTTFYVLDPQGRIWGSALNDPTTWTALNEITMQNEPTGGVAIAKLSTYVVAFGQWTTEFFLDAGIAPPASPLLPQTSIPVNVGCAAGESVREMQNSIVWVGQTKTEGQGVYVFNGYIPQRISTAFIDRIIQSDPLTNISAYNLDAAGYSLYVLTLHTSNITLVYNFFTGQWDVWTSSTAKPTVTVQSLTCDPYGLVTATAMGHGLSDGDPVTIAGASNGAYNGLWNAQVTGANSFQYLMPAATSNNLGTATLTGYLESAFLPVASTQIRDNDYLQDPINGVVYTQSITFYGDLTNPINTRIVTERVDGGTSEWKHCRRISLLGDLVSSNAMIAYSDNDYQSYSAFRPMQLGVGQRATVTPAGRFRRRAFQIRHTAFTPFRAEALELELIPGGF